MQENKDTVFIERSDAVLRGNLTNPPQLTPTGKISHAKTRVYTQRYRKAWEQMPDFKGWLTSVPHQPTRAFCTYCRKNLHAHRLSLLKHTCTMKHQRGALMHQKETNAKANIEAKISQEEDERMQDDPDDVEEDQEFKLEDEAAEDDDDEIEYVVERLDDDEMEEDPSKDVGDVEYADDDEEESLPMAKKIKRNDEENASRPDTLAEAMAHVHGEYLDENGDSVNVELDMVVESVNPNNHDMRIVSVRSEREDEGGHQMGIESFDPDDNSTDYNPADQDKDEENVGVDPTGISSCKSSMLGESSDAASEMDETSEQLVERNTPPISMRRDYMSRSSTPRESSSLLSTTNTGSNGPSATKKKTITITSGGKTVTLDTLNITNYTGPAKFLLNTKAQGSPGIVIADKTNQASKGEGQIKIVQQTSAAADTSTSATSAYSNPSSSQSTTRKHIILKSVKPLVVKKPCISTHVLDTSKGLPVGGLQISLYKLMDGRWTFLHESNTTPDGRCADLVDTSTCTFTAGRYKLHFDVDKYFTLRRIETMYPFIEIIFDVKNPTEHYHVPVLISPFGYTTYRGS